MRDVVVRDAREGDATGVAAIYAHEVEHGTATFDTVAPSVEDWRERIAGATDDGQPFLVAEVDGDDQSGGVVGYALTKPWRGERPAYRFTVEDAIYVAPSHGGRGIGTAMLHALVDRSREAGVRSVVAVVADADAPASIRLHQRSAAGSRTSGSEATTPSTHGPKHGQGTVVRRHSPDGLEAHRGVEVA